MPKLPSAWAPPMPYARQLAPLPDFGSNPGALTAYLHIPPSLAPDAALVVVLHGCTQTAAGYDRGAGWSDIANRHGFAVLFPEQQRRNNANLCFNWFVPGDSRRDAGEALSIRQMIAAVVAAHQIDPARIFVTGLSAGGAMTSVMLATYPELFAGGAIIAGLPFGCAATIPEALDRMRGNGLPGENDLAGLVRDASPHAGPWPTVSIWHGSADATVNPSNVEAILNQWRSLHGVNREPDRTEVVHGYPRRIWRNADGRDVIEEFSITGLAHGTPLDTRTVGGCGLAGPHMLEADISSTQHICRFWGLMPPITHRRASRSGTYVEQPTDQEHRFPASRPAIDGVTATIEQALRTAGLLR